MEECELQNICRACLTEQGEFQSIFVPEISSGISLHISEMMTACASIQITVGDGLPEQICKTCAADTLNLYLFKLKCEKTDKTLREKLLKNDVCNSDIIKCNENLILAEHLKCEETENNTNDRNLNEFDSFFDSYSNDSYESEHDKEKNEMTPKEKPREFWCDICTKQFTRNDLLLRHRIAHAMKMENQKLEFDSSYQLDGDDDEDNYVGIKDLVYACNKCDSIFVQKDDLDTHLKSHFKEEYNVSCQICHKKFSKLAHLNRHLRSTHFIEKQYKCEVCEKSYHRQEQLRNHMNGHTGLKPHICDICCKGFNQISNLKDHMRTHNGEKPFLCSTCGKGFNQLGNLRQHTVRHSGIKAHLCSTCGSGFASKGELSAHLRKHTGARPFVCSVCNHGFTTSSSLTKHKRIHSGEKPYECDTCKMKFSRSGILARHKRTHTGEKPYKCKFCLKAFSQSNDLTSHQRIHTGEKPFICDECGQAFRQSSALKTHKKTHIEKRVSQIKIEKNTCIVEAKSIFLKGTFNTEFLPGF
ncbi:unnamed protein product [Psylliodes chrysocephalus]|uniref:C2H2-type domain-containing protein n=1 Tax=Psylliodes chrysocephalus TaxID=3402493 RepID=A0A9P0GDP9_9CUCU|nr:unnamed protein product [Psylliodes chrysocephala]